MADIRFKEIQEILGEAEEQNQEALCEEKIISALSVPNDLAPDALEIILGLAECSDGYDSVAFSYLDEVLYVRVYDGEKYLFPLPFMLTETADAQGACVNLAAYSVREMIPLIITDVPRDELEFISSVFPHIDAYTYEDDDDSFFIKVNNECDMISDVPTFELDGIVLDELCDGDREVYAELCRDRELNRFWGYDADEDNPDGNADFYLDVARREFADGIAITLAVREGGKFVGEATVYGFDYRGSASIAVRILKGSHSRGLGSRATKALISLAKSIGLSRLSAEILNENEASVRMTEKFMSLESRTETKTYFTLSL